MNVLELNGARCGGRCHTARSPRSECRCPCGGALHGAGTEAAIAATNTHEKREAILEAAHARANRRLSAEHQLGFDLPAAAVAFEDEGDAPTPTSHRCDPMPILFAVEQGPGGKWLLRSAETPVLIVACPFCGMGLREGAAAGRGAEQQGFTFGGTT